jgi:tetratricopeptide (TPR) repeat protein
MNPRLRVTYYAIGIITIVILAIIMVPRSLSLYYQTRGGQQIEYILRFEEGIDELICEELSSSDQDAFDEVERAITSLNQAIRLNRNNSQAYYYLGKAYCIMGKPEQARENYLQYTVLRPDNPLGYIGLGFVYEMMGDESSAVNAWKSASTSSNDFNSRGDEEFKAVSYDEAKRWYERAILIDPSNEQAWYSIGKVEEELGNHEAALETFKQALILFPKNMDIHLALGNLYLNISKNYQEAIQVYQKATQLEALPIEAYLGVGKAAEGLLDQDRSLEAYLTAVELSNQVDGNTIHQFWLRVWPKYVLGDYYLRMGELDKASLAFQEAIEADKYKYYAAWSYWGLGRVALFNEDTSTAIQQFNQALENKANYYLKSQIYLGIGQAHVQQGDLDTAIDYVRKAHDEHPDNQGLHRYLAELLTEAGYYQEAIAEYGAIIMKWPADLAAKKALDAILEKQ